ncbi:zinc finger HIT domain-containing protein 3 [Condylostylus longicornis]|uniref:zinc finger HIT domain-containing protein 3 n=1 Tax=Condylostylus longicornis TaxID=2530218 RepID=UPI00244D99E3|nr:zinc finger HIT domain-containing protein 3 [Condylostylus longicornis]XP_055386770.1 zinc finger HIT domain-containing protein 3 [Condylostylus longicornis]
MLCIVCRNETNKYKCPKCFEYYCSVGCYKSHTESNNCKVKESKSTEENVDNPRIILPFTTEDTVDIALLKKLEKSDELRKLLENPHLRNYLLEVDRAPSAWKAMKVAMQEPLFIEFADACLKVVEPENK